MATKEEIDWGKILGAVLAVILLICVWIACGGWLIEKVNGGEKVSNHRDERR